MHSKKVDAERIRRVTIPPYFIATRHPYLPIHCRTPRNTLSLDLIVDKYRELQGFVFGKTFRDKSLANSPPRHHLPITGLPLKIKGSIIPHSACPPGETDRRTGANIPLDDPKTLNKIILKFLEDIPKSASPLVIAGHQLEILRTQDRRIRDVRMIPSPSIA